MEAWDSERVFFKTLIDMIGQDCLITKPGDTLEGTLDSFSIGAYARAIILLAEAGLIEIDAEAGQRVCGTFTPEGHALWQQEP